jgi:hypothetical protein
MARHVGTHCWVTVDERISRGHALAAPRHVMGTVSSLSGLGRNLGFALGPALATIVWTVSGSDLGGIRAGLVLMVAVTAVGALTAALVRSAPQEERDQRMLVK